MSTIEIGEASEDAAHDDAETFAGPRPRRRGIVFWVCRYLPAEIAGTAAMILAGLGVTIWTDAPPILALAAIVGESTGFYLVLAVTIFIELSGDEQGWRRTAIHTFLLLAAEFGAAELLDTFLVRPGALMLGVWLIPDPLWGMLAGKVAADLIFYAVAAGAFTLTVKTGLRARPAATQAPAPEPDAAVIA